LSYLILDPASVKVRPTPEWSVRDPSAPDPGRKVTRGMGGLDPMAADLAAAREAAEPIDRTYREALDTYNRAVERYDDAKAAYKEDVYKALAARPEAERTAAVAKQLEGRAALTAVPDVGADPVVAAARSELKDARNALMVAAKHRKALREKIALLESRPGYVADDSAEGLATEPLRHSGNNNPNKAVLTPGGQVKAGAYQARLDQLDKELADSTEKLGAAMKEADKNAPKPKQPKETPAQKAAATRKKNAEDLLRAQEEDFREIAGDLEMLELRPYDALDDAPIAPAAAPVPGAYKTPAATATKIRRSAGRSLNAAGGAGRDQGTAEA